ncbi:MAG: hypothetical protein AAB469_00825 [Patescibacteria group bacterium]
MKYALLIIVCSGLAFVGGYFLGVKQNRKAVTQNQASPTPAVEVKTGYENPFEGVKFNPFK